MQNKAIDYCVNWLKELDIKQLEYKVLQCEQRTPCLYVKVKGEKDK